MRVTPEKMLTIYRRHAPEGNKAQVKRFMAMSPDDRMELLFFMALSAGGVIKMITDRIGLEGDELDVEEATKTH